MQNMKFNKKTKKLDINFSQSSKLKNNFNTPKAVTKSVVIYFLRTLKDNIPLNEGALKILISFFQMILC